MILDQPLVGNEPHLPILTWHMASTDPESTPKNVADIINVDEK